MQLCRARATRGFLEQSANAGREADKTTSVRDSTVRSGSPSDLQLCVGNEDDSTELSSKLQQTELDRDMFYDTVMIQQVVNWIGPLDFDASQAFHLSRSQNHSAAAILTSEQFQAWANTARGTLWCKGVSKSLCSLNGSVTC
jgi:hypothetical protein